MFLPASGGSSLPVIDRVWGLTISSGCWLVMYRVLAIGPVCVLTLALGFASLPLPLILLSNISSSAVVVIICAVICVVVIANDSVQLLLSLMHFASGTV